MQRAGRLMADQFSTPSPKVTATWEGRGGSRSATKHKKKNIGRRGGPDYLLTGVLDGPCVPRSLSPGLASDGSVSILKGPASTTRLAFALPPHDAPSKVTERMAENVETGHDICAQRENGYFVHYRSGKPSHG